MKGRTAAAVALVTLGLAMLAWSASASFATARDAPPVPAAEVPAVSSDASPDVRAVLLVQTPILSREQGVDVPDVGVPAPIGLDRRVDTGELPLGARVAILLTDDAPAPAVASAPAPTRVASDRFVVTPGASMALGAATLTLAGLATYFWGGLKSLGFRLLVLPVLPLYARISRADVFDNSVREAIFQAIRADPGLSASDLAKTAGVSWGTTIYHLDVLEQNRMVSSLRNGRHRRYFENGAALTAPKETVAILQNPVTASVVTQVRHAPGATQKELAARVGLTPQALHWHLQRLVQVGVVQKVREGRVVRHFASS